MSICALKMNREIDREFINTFLPINVRFLCLQMFNIFDIFDIKLSWAAQNFYLLMEQTNWKLNPRVDPIFHIGKWGCVPHEDTLLSYLPPHMSPELVEADCRLSIG